MIKTIFTEQNLKRYQGPFLWGLTVIFLVALAVYVKSQWNIMSSLFTVPWSDLLLMVFCWILLSLPRNLIRKLMARKLGIELQFVDWYGLSMVSNLMSLVMPSRTDMVFSSIYLRKKYGLSITHFFSMLYGNTILLGVVLGLEGLIGLTLFLFFEGKSDWRIWVIMSGIVIATLPFAILPKGIFKRNNWVMQKIYTMVEGWEIIRSSTRLILQLSGLIVLNSIIFTLWMYVSYLALDFKVGFLPVFLAGIVTQLSFFVTLTPGNLGLREALVGFISQATGLGFAEGVAITLLQRVVSTVVFIAFGLVFWLLLLPSYKNNQEIKIDAGESVDSDK